MGQTSREQKILVQIYDYEKEALSFVCPPGLNWTLELQKAPDAPSG